MSAQSTWLVIALVPLLTGAAPFVPSRDRNGDPLPDYALARLGTVRPQPTAASALSADGKLLILSGNSGTFVHDPATGKQLRQIGWAIESAQALALAADGKTLAVGGHRRPVRIFDLRTQQLLITCADSPEWVSALRFSPDGRTLLAGGGTEIRLWDVATGRLKHRFSDQPNIKSLALSANRKTIIVTSLKSDAYQLNVADGKADNHIDFRSEKTVQALAWASHDGKSFAGNDGDATIRLWDARGKEQRQFGEGLPGTLLVAEFSADGKRLATSCVNERAVRLWDPATGKQLIRLESKVVNSFLSLAFTPDGKTLLGLTASGELRRWDTSSGDERGQPDGLLDGQQRLSLSPDGKTLATGADDGSLRLWDVTTGREQKRLIASGNRVESVVISPNGKRLAARSPDGDVRLWNLETGKEMKSLAIPRTRNLVRFDFSPDSVMMVTHGPTRLWQVETSRERARLAKDVPDFSALFTPDGKSLVTLAQDQTIRVWSTDSGKEQRSIAMPLQAFEAVFSSDGKQLAMRTIAQGTIVLLDFKTGKVIRRVTTFPEPTRLSFTERGDLVTGGSIGQRVWSARDGKELNAKEGHHGPIVAGVFREEGTEVATIGGDRVLRFWDAKTGRQTKVVEEWPIPPGYIGPAAFTPDGKYLVYPGFMEQSALVYELGAGKMRGLGMKTKSQFHALAVSDDGRNVAVRAFSPGVQVIDLPGRKERMIFKESGIFAFVPGHDWLAQVERSSGEVKVWDLGEKKEQIKIKFHSAAMPGQLAFSRDGSMMATVSGAGLVRVFELSSGAERFRLIVSDRGRGVRSVAFSPDCRSLAASDDEGNVSLWDASAPETDEDYTKNPFGGPAGKRLLYLTGHRGPVNALAFSPSGKVLLSASEDTTAIVWDLTSLPRSMPAKLSKEELKGLYADLNDDAVTAYRAIRRLVEVPELSVPFLAERLTNKTPQPTQIHRAIEVIERAGGQAAGKALLAMSKNNNADLAAAAGAAYTRMNRSK